MWLLGLDDAQLQSGLGLRPEEIAVLRGGSSRNLGRPRAVSVCRQSISDSWLGNLRECLAHLVKGSGCDCLLMQAASLLDGFSFDLFPPFKNGLTAPEVDVSRRLWVAFVGLTSTATRVAARIRSPRRREA